jgi:hypothetical protein
MNVKAETLDHDSHGCERRKAGVVRLLEVFIPSYGICMCKDRWCNFLKGFCKLEKEMREKKF